MKAYVAGGKVYSSKKQAISTGETVEEVADVLVWVENLLTLTEAKQQRARQLEIVLSKMLHTFSTLKSSEVGLEAEKLLRG